MFKIIGLAALAAMALAAFAASSASAATICSTAGKGTACKSGHGNQYTGAIVAKNNGNVLLNVTDESGKVINVVTSTSSTLEGTVTNSEEGTGDITKLTFSGLSSTLCSSVTASTTASTTSPWPTTMATDEEKETNGIMTASNVGGSFTCTFLGFPVTCKYSVVTTKTTIDGSDTAPKATAKDVFLGTVSGNPSVCGVGADWNGAYNITTPSSLFIE